MSPEEVAALFDARRVGPGRWMARCTVHRDRSPSLSIRSGRDGRTLLKCFAGCDTRAVLATRGLTLGDLFPGPPPTRAEQRKAREQGEAEDAEERRRNDAAWCAADGYRRLSRVQAALGAKLAWCSDGSLGDVLAKAFHRIARMLCEIESEMGCYGEVKAPPVKPYPPWSPFPEAEPEAMEAGRVMTEEQALCYVRTGFAEPPPPEQQNEEARANEPQNETEKELV